MKEDDESLLIKGIEDPISHRCDPLSQLEETLVDMQKAFATPDHLSEVTGWLDPAPIALACRETEANPVPVLRLGVFCRRIPCT